MAKEKLFMVFNNTDRVHVTFEPVTEAEADEVIKNFPDRFKHQGYYLTGGRERIRPEDVVLRKQEFIDDEDEDDEPIVLDPEFMNLSPVEKLYRAAECALADLEGIMPDWEPSGDRKHPGWRTINELRDAIASYEKS